MKGAISAKEKVSPEAAARAEATWSTPRKGGKS